MRNPIRYHFCALHVVGKQHVRQVHEQLHPEAGELPGRSAVLADEPPARPGHRRVGYDDVRLEEPLPQRHEALLVFGDVREIFEAHALQNAVPAAIRLVVRVGLAHVD